MSSPASLGLTKNGNEYRIAGKKGGLIKINKMTVPQLKAYGAKYTEFTNKNRTKKQVLNKIYAAKTKLRQASNSGNSVASALLALQNKSSSYNANKEAAKVLAGLAKKSTGNGKARINALLQVAAQKPSPSSSASSLGLMKAFGASGGFRLKGAKGPVKIGKMSVAQLKAYAVKHNVNVNGLTKKDQIMATIYKKKFGRNLYKVKPLVGSSSGSVNNVMNAVLNNMGRSSSPKAKPKAKPMNGSLGLMNAMGASGGYRFKGARGAKKINKTMTLPVLKKYASNYGVNVSRMHTKKEILNAVYKKKYGAANVSSNKPPTMVISHAAAAKILAAAKPKPAGPHKRPVKRTKVLEEGELNQLLGN